MPQVIIFLICSSLVFPLFFLYPFTYYKTVQYFFTLPSISALALAFTFISSRKLKENFEDSRILLILSVLFLFVPVIQLFMFSTIDTGQFFYSIIWVTVPFFAFIYSKELKKALPIYFFIYLLFDIFNSILQSGEVVGIAGNRNWHAATLAIIIPFTIYLGREAYLKFSQKYNKIAVGTIITLILVITTLSSLLLIFVCKTRTIFALFPALIIIFLFLQFRKKYRKTTLSLLFLAFIVFGSFFVMSIYHPESSKPKPLAVSAIQHEENTLKAKFAEQVDRDVRGPLWKGCIDLISAHPYLGVSAPRFESEFQLYRPIDYFLKPDNAVRSNHPHNSILYMAASYGMPGMLLWLIIWALPMIVCLIRYYKLSTVSKIILFSYILLFIHSLMDLIFFEWPTVFFAAVFIGLLWSDVLKKQNIPEKLPTQSKSKPSKISKIEVPAIPRYVDYSCKALAVIIIIITLRLVYLDTVSSYYFRLGEYAEVDGYKLQAADYYGQGVSYERDPQYVYKAATTYLQDLNMTDKAMTYLNMFNGMSVSNYAHSNGFMALALVKQGKLKEALPYLLKEVVIYPLLIGSWYRLTYVQGSLGMKQEAEVSFTNMMEALKYKNLTPYKRTIYFLLDNPTYDSHPDRIPADILQQLNAP